MCVCGGGTGERGGGREGERRGRERGRTSGLSQSVRFFFFSPLILFHVMGLVLRRRNGTEKNTLLLLFGKPIGAGEAPRFLSVGRRVASASGDDSAHPVPPSVS